VPRLCEFYPGICLTTEEKARKNLSQVKKNFRQSTVYILYYIMIVTVDDVTSRALSNAGACLPDHMTSRSSILTIQDTLRRVLSAVRVAVVMFGYVITSSAFAQYNCVLIWVLNISTTCALLNHVLFCK
jgi:hypothetical protein